VRPRWDDNFSAWHLPKGNKSLLSLYYGGYEGGVGWFYLLGAGKYEYMRIKIDC